MTIAFIAHAFYCIAMFYLMSRLAPRFAWQIVPIATPAPYRDLLGKSCGEAMGFTALFGKYDAER